jgi:hypothetical protein
MALDRDRQLDPLPTTRTQDCLRERPDHGSGTRLTAHIKESRRACPAGRWSAAPARARTLVIVVQAAKVLAMDLTPMHKRVIALDVHQAKITACAMVEHDDGHVEVTKRDFGAFKRDRRALAA